MTNEDDPLDDGAAKPEAPAAVGHVTDATEAQGEASGDPVAGDSHNEGAHRRRLLEVSRQNGREYEALKDTPSDRSGHLRLIEKVMVENEALQRDCLDKNEDKG